MRISTQWLFRGAIRDLNAALKRTATAEETVASGRRVNRVSDDPADAARIMKFDAQLHDVDQFRRNGTIASTRFAVEDQVLTTAIKLVQQAKDLALANSTRAVGDPLRAEAATQVDQIRQQILSLANTRVGNAYIFGGGESTTPPFLGNGTYVGTSLANSVELDDGVTVPSNHTGDQIFQGMLGSLANLSNELVNGTGGPAAYLAISDSIANADQRMRVAQAELGGWQQQVQQVGEDLARRSSNLLDQRSALRDVDPTEAMLQLSSTQTALERAYAAVGKVISVSLVDYLR